MTKAELVDKVAATIQLPKHQTATVVDLFLAQTQHLNHQPQTV
jgi:nucleoid DNA-binding protein